MSDLVELVRAYCKAPKLAEQLRWSDAIIRVVGPPLGLFVVGLAPEAAKDVTQEVLNSIAGGLRTFKGHSNEEFWKWCHTIARRRIADYIRKAKRDKLHPLPDEELLDLIDDSAQAMPLSAADRHDLYYALRLLASSKPECRDYLWQHYVVGLDYAEIAGALSVSYDNARMKIGRCLESARTLVANHATQPAT